MKRKLLTLIIALVAVFGLVSVANHKEAKAVKMTGGEVLYLTPNANWNVDNARFAAYFFGSGNTWAGMTKVEGETNLYEVTAPSGNWTNVIFCRMNPSSTTNSWDTKWNQTSDLVYDGTNNHYTVKEGTWDKGGGTWSVYTLPGEEIEAYQELAGIVNPFYNNGTYVRNTVINIDMTDAEVKQDLYYAFHAQSFHTERTTYFYPNELWMTNSAGVNSGYGTNAEGHMYHFSYNQGVKVVDYTVAEKKDVETWYTTLADIQIDETQGWTVENDVYTSNDPVLVKQFLDFTAPCFYNYDTETTANIFTLSHVTINKTANNELVMKLYVKEDTKGFIADGSTLLSTAIITVEDTYSIKGSFTNDDWSTELFFKHTDLTDGLYFDIEIAGSTTPYEFKYLKNGSWFGNDGTMDNGTNGFEWIFDANVNDNCKLTATGGVYLFKVNPATNGVVVTAK